MSEFRPPQKPSKLRVILAIAIVVLTLAPTIALAVVALGMTHVAYVIGNGSLEVQSGDVFFGSRKVALADITEARSVALYGARRTSGTAMSGYCVGHYRYSELGAVWQATNCSRYGVVVRAKNQPEPLVLTPPDPRAFAAQILAGTPTSVSLPPPSTNPLQIAAVIALPIAMAVSTLVVVVLIFGPTRMRYSIEGRELHIRTLFSHKHWPAREIRAHRHAPKRMWRIAGAAMPGYVTGIFRDEDALLRVYASDTTRGILLESPLRVFINPEDETAFLDALQKAGAIVPEQ